MRIARYLLRDGGIRVLEISGSTRQLREAVQRAVRNALPMHRPPLSADPGDQFIFSMQFRLNA